MHPPRDSSFFLRVSFARSPGLKGRAVRASRIENLKLSEWLTVAIEEKLGSPKDILEPKRSNTRPL